MRSKDPAIEPPSTTTSAPNLFDHRRESTPEPSESLLPHEVRVPVTATAPTPDLDHIGRLTLLRSDPSGIGRPNGAARHGVLQWESGVAEQVDVAVGWKGRMTGDRFTPNEESRTDPGSDRHAHRPVTAAGSAGDILPDTESLGVVEEPQPLRWVLDPVQQRTSQIDAVEAVELADTVVAANPLDVVERSGQRHHQGQAMPQEEPVRGRGELIHEFLGAAPRVEHRPGRSGGGPSATNAAVTCVPPTSSTATVSTPISRAVALFVGTSTPTRVCVDGCLGSVPCGSTSGPATMR